MSNRKIVVTSRFKNSVKINYNYIQQHSVQNAEKFLNELFEVMEQIPKNPEAYSLEHRLPTKRKLYRYKLYKKHYRIIFKTLNKQLIFVDFFHTAQNPDKIKKLRTNKYD